MWLCCAACRILVPRQGFNPPLAVKVSPTHWTARDFSQLYFFFLNQCICVHLLHIRFLFNLKNAFIYLFIYGYAESLLLQVFSQCSKQEKGLLIVVLAYTCCGTRDSRLGRASSCNHWASTSSCGPQA